MKKSLAKPIRFGSALVAMLMAASVMAAPDDQGGDPRRFFKGKEDGWFWYKDPKEVLEQKPEQKTVQPAKSQAKKDEPFSVEWLRKNMPVFLDRAIDNPSKENVEAYLYSQRVAMDKSQRYAEKAQQVVYSDPILDENNRVPLASFAKPFFLRSISAATNDAMKHLAKSGGIWMFFDSACDFCKVQANIVQELSKQHGFVVKFISMDGKGLPNTPNWVKDNGHAAMLNLRITPTTVFVVPPNNYLIVSQGMMAQEQLAERIVIAGESNNLIPSEIVAKMRLYDRGVLTAEDTARGASDDPKEWVKHLKDKLMGRY